VKLDELSLDDSFEVFASWWLPDKPQDRLPGTLMFSPSDGALLELQGKFQLPALTDLQLVFAGPMFQAEFIYGERPDGQLITLHRAITTYLGATSSFHCHIVLAGAHLSPTVSLKDASAIFSYDNLEEWSCMRLLEFGSAPDNDCYSYLFRHNAVQLLSVPKSDSHPELELYGNVRGSLTHNEAKFYRKTHFRASELDLDSLDCLFELTSSVGQLLTVLIGKPANLTKLRLLPDSDTCIEVFFQRSRPAKAHEVHAHQMPFNLADLDDQSTRLFSEWFESYSLLRPAYAAFFSTLFNDSSYIDAKFQAIMQAIESFHRRTRPGVYVAQEEYGKFYAALVDAIPKEVSPPLKERLKSALKYGNELSLRKRLKDLASELDEKTLQTIQIDQEFINEVVETR